MSIKERILTIRLLQTIQSNPEYTKMLGVEGVVRELRSQHFALAAVREPERMAVAA